jgi:hypothetical protein
MSPDLHTGRVAEPAGKAAAPNTGNRRTLVVMTADPVNLRVIGRIARRVGYRVRTAARPPLGGEALLVDLDQLVLVGFDRPTLLDAVARHAGPAAVFSYRLTEAEARELDRAGVLLRQGFVSNELLRRLASC